MDSSADAQAAVDVENSIQFESSDRYISSIRTNQGILVLPVTPQLKKSGSATSGADHHHVVPNCCAICLEAYKIGESVTWSNNNTKDNNVKCQHAFHTDCIVKHLAQVMQQKNNNDGKKLPCPMCRQQFLINF